MTRQATGQTSKENEFAIKVLEAIKSGSYENYNKLIVNRKGLEELFAVRARNDKTARLQDPGARLENFDKEADSAYKSEFNRIVRKGEKLGIDWTHVSFSDFINTTNKHINSSNILLTGHINFMSNGSFYVVFGVQALETDSGYKLSLIRSIQKGGVKEYVDPDLMDDEDL